MALQIPLRSAQSPLTSNLPACIVNEMFGDPEVHFSTRFEAHQVFTSVRTGEVDFTHALHSWRLFTSPWREANFLEPREMVDAPVHGQSKTGAGAPDHACSVMCLSRVSESEEVFCKAHALHLVVRRIGGHDPNRKMPAQTKFCWCGFPVFPPLYR